MIFFQGGFFVGYDSGKRHRVEILRWFNISDLNQLSLFFHNSLSVGTGLQQVPKFPILRYKSSIWQFLQNFKTTGTGCANPLLRRSSSQETGANEFGVNPLGFYNLG